MKPIVFDLIVRTRNPLNGGHPGTKWATAARSAERKRHRQKARESTRGALCLARLHAADVIPCVVTLTRYSAGKMDTDGLAASQKGIRDGIADALGVNDGGPFVEWQYEQASCPKGVFGVRVRIDKRITIRVSLDSGLHVSVPLTLPKEKHANHPHVDVHDQSRAHTQHRGQRRRGERHLGAEHAQAPRERLRRASADRAQG